MSIHVKPVANKNRTPHKAEVFNQIRSQFCKISVAPLILCDITGRSTSLMTWKLKQQSPDGKFRQPCATRQLYKKEDITPGCSFDLHTAQRLN